MKKSDTRQSLSNQRAQLEDSYRSLAAKHIFKNLVSLEVIANAGCIHSYLSYGKEVATLEWIEYFWSQQQQVVIPFLDSSFTMKHSLLTSFEHLEKGPYGILQPQQQHYQEINEAIIDVVIAPGLGFSPSGHRLGYGKGYYDRFLSRVSAHRIGVGFDCQVIPELPYDSHDVPMHHIITEKRVISCT